METFQIKDLKLFVCNNNKMKINSYVLTCKDSAIIIDPYDFDEVYKVVGNFKVDYIFLTHEHFDHINAVDKLREKFNVKVVAHEIASINIQNSSLNLSKYSQVILNFMNIEPEHQQNEITIKKADLAFKKTYNILWKDNKIIFQHTPGHSQGGCCILINKWIFVGDSLFEKVQTNIKGPGASRKDYINKTITYLRSLSLDLHVFSGHYNSFILGDRIHEKLF